MLVYHLPGSRYMGSIRSSRWIWTLFRRTHVICLIPILWLIYGSDATNGSKPGIVIRVDHQEDSEEPGVTLTSPNYPGTYPENLTSSWILETDLFLKLKIEVKHLDIESASNCSKDSLTIYDGFSSNLSSALVTLCGNGQPGTMTTAGNQAVVKFVSDMDISGTGFRLSISAIKEGEDIGKSDGWGVFALVTFAIILLVMVTTTTVIVCASRGRCKWLQRKIDNRYAMRTGHDTCPNVSTINKIEENRRQTRYKNFNSTSGDGSSKREKMEVKHGSWCGTEIIP